jgi:glucose/arabinose dehydrogenase
VIKPSVGASEVALLRSGRRVLPQLVRAFPPEADERLVMGSDWMFTSRIQFEMKEEPLALERILNKPVELQIKQTWRPLGGDKGGTAASGFRREVQFTGVPNGWKVEWNAVPAETIILVDQRRVARSTGAYPFEVALLDGQVKFEAEGGAARIQLQPDATGMAQVELEYRTALPVDRYLQKAPAEVVVRQESLHVVPGFEATRLPLSEELTPTAFAWDRRGNLLFATLKGRIWRAEDTDHDNIEDAVTLVADGLSAPFGLATIEEQGVEAIDVADKTALLRMADTDGDGTIDRTRTVASHWGHSTDYHGWIVGLPRDAEGNYYAVVSNRDGPAAHLRGRVIKLKKLAQPHPAHRAYQIQPLAMGLRFPVGIARNQQGALFVTDNQGPFNPYNELNHIVSGSHYGFFNLSGLENQTEIVAMPRSGPTIGIPHPWVRSVNGICFLETPAALLIVTGQKLFGPFEGHLIGCEASTRQLIRMSLQRVGDRYQGAAYPFTISPPRGTNTLLRPLVAQVATDGAILVGSVHDSAWGAGRNVGEIVKLRFRGPLPVGIAEMRAVEYGFELEFTGPIDRAKATDLANYRLVSYRRIPTPA